MLNNKLTSNLEKIRWGDQPQCPYCGSTNGTPIRKEGRYHCNACFTSYSVTVGTLFHKSHIEFPKWVRAIELVLNSPTTVSVRQLAKEIEVNKNTACSMLTRIRKAMIEEQELLNSLLEQELPECSIDWLAPR